MLQERQDHEPPFALATLGWRYHHVGIPTMSPRPDEVYLPKLKMYVSGFDTSPYGVEWMRFEPGCPVSELIRTVPHVAFEVDDLDAALVGRTRLGEVTSPSDGVRVAMIVDNGAPIELLEFRRVAQTCALGMSALIFTLSGTNRAGRIACATQFFSPEYTAQTRVSAPPRRLALHFPGRILRLHLVSVVRLCRSPRSLDGSMIQAVSQSRKATSVEKHGLLFCCECSSD